MPETYKYPFISKQQNYSTFAQPFANGGVVARYVSDRLPAGKYLSLQNLESRQENSLASRYSPTSQITPNGGIANASVFSIARLKGTNGQAWRYVKLGNGHIYRRAGNTSGAFTDIDSGYDTTANYPRLSALTYRPNLSAVPYIFFADAAKMTKDNGATLSKWGIDPPTRLPSAVLGGAAFATVLNLDVDAGLTYNAGFTGHAAVAQVNTTIAAGVGATGVQTVTPVSMANIIVGSLLRIDTGNPNDEFVVVTSVSGSSFTAAFAKTHGAAVTVQDSAITATDAGNSVSANGLALDLRTPGSTSNAAGGDTFSFLIRSATAANLRNLQFTMLDGSGGTATIILYNYNTGDPTLNNDYFPGLVDGVWYQTTWKRSLMQTSGGFDWSNVTSVTITVGFSVATAFGVNDFVLLAGGPDATGGVPYDWRVTFFNLNTGEESNPSQTFIDNARVTTFNQPVTITWTASADPQVTHVRIYRRGGTLANAWYLVQQVAIGTTTWIDTVPDSVAVEGQQLATDNDRPCTTTLAAPVNTTLGSTITAGVRTVTPASMNNIFQYQYVTIGSGSTAEVVLVESTTGTQFTAQFQYAHSSTEVVSADTKPDTPMNLGAIAFERAWLAGDPNNPHILYYSKPQAPSSFPPQNTLEIGAPSDPIMALVVLRGQLFVFTLTRIYTIAVIGSSPPYALPTASKHGLAASWAWCIGEGVIYYLSQDGPREFSGGVSDYMGQDTELVWTGKSSISQIPVLDTSNFAACTMAFYHNEVYLSFNNLANNLNRMVWHTQYKRWRNDVMPFEVFSMFNEEDADTLLLGMSGGKLLQDRVGNLDSNGNGGTQSFNILCQTAYLDQELPKNEKNYAELWLDIDTGGQSLSAVLLFNNGATSVSIPNIVATGRTKLCFNLNSGQGYTAYNMSLQFGGAVSTAAVYLYAASIRYVVTPERRVTSDSFWQDEGSPAWKFMDQGWFEYEAFDAAGISCSMYLDGSATAAFTFTLPQATVRNEVRITFPAVKYRVRRLVMTSVSDFKLYGNTFLQWKPIPLNIGYAKAILKETP